MQSAFKNPITKTIVAFLTNLGLEVRSGRLADGMFLSGIRIDHGTLVVDEEKLTYPGDLLHEAGHLAVSPAALRPTLDGEVLLPDVPMESVEAQAIAWSYAALIHLGLDPKVVFHEGGYRGQASGLESNFNIGVYIGLQGLIDAGLTGNRGSSFAYPQMIKWLRD